MGTEHDAQTVGISRRNLLASGGAIAVASSLPRGLAAEQPAARRFVLPEGRFGRLFPGLRPFAEPSGRLNAAMLELGRPGGLLDAQDDLAAGPVRLITDPSLSANNPNNPAHTAGTTFVGQFMDHDLTFDPTSRLGRPAKPRNSPNARTPAFDLDSVYGGGPLASPELYLTGEGRGRERPTKFKVEHGGRFEDLPRDPRTSAALIADPRNDENLMIGGLHAAFLLFHNRAVDLLAGADRSSPDDLFDRARRLTTWHYQWMILHEFLPLFVGQALVDDILQRGRRFYRPPAGFIPVEFQAAAYRFGHSLVRPSYRANLAGDADDQPFFGMIFDPTGEGAHDPVDLRGGARAPRRFIGWQTFFDFGGVHAAEVKPNKLIDAKISTPLFHLPLGAIPGLEQAVVALPQRNLLRHVTWGLPSGQSIARHLEVPALAKADLSELGAFGHGLDESTPLWYYVLKESEVMEGGQRLGPVGGRIVGEVIVGLLQLDRDSYLSEARWRPTLPTRGGPVTGDFRMIDFLTFAGVDPTSRGQ
jgi:hypothetical protein